MKRGYAVNSSPRSITRSFHHHQKSYLVSWKRWLLCIVSSHFWKNDKIVEVTGRFGVTAIASATQWHNLFKLTETASSFADQEITEPTSLGSGWQIKVPSQIHLGFTLTVQKRWDAVARNTTGCHACVLEGIRVPMQAHCLRYYDSAAI